MAGSYKVSVKVVSKLGHCGSGHKVGNEWIVGRKIPGGICISAFSYLLPSIQVLKFGGSFPWENNPDVTTIACPDAENKVVYELKRLKE